MVGIKPNLNAAFAQKIQDWLSQCWIPKEQNVDYQAALERVIHALWPDHVQIPGATQPLSYLPLPGLCSYALGGANPLTTQVNAAWVLLYLASYLLDKVEDQETQHPIFSIYDQSTVVNITTGLILYSQRILVELAPDQGHDAVELHDAVKLDDIRRVFNRAALEVCAGQHADLTLKAPTLDQSWEIISAKSGKFFSLGAYLGTRLVTDNPEILGAFSAFGEYLGIIIQIANDLRGMGKERETGSDLASRKRTLPVQFALAVLAGEERSRLIQMLHAAPSDPQAEIESRRMLLSAGAIVYLSLEAQKYRQQAMNALNMLNLNRESVSPLFELLDYASHHRKHGSGL